MIMAFEAQQTGARTYSLNWIDSQGVPRARVVTVDDAVVSRVSSCLLNDREHPITSLLSCYARHAQWMPLLVFKKTVALFDNFQLNSYAAYVTHWPSLILNRTFGLMAYLGFFSLVVPWIICIRLRRWHLWMLAYAYALVYWAVSLIPSTDSRYGFPLVPFGIAGFVWILGQWKNARIRRWIILGWLILASAFLLQTAMWDLHDPLFFSYYWGRAL